MKQEKTSLNSQDVTEKIYKIGNFYFFLHKHYDHLTSYRNSIRETEIK